MGTILLGHNMLSLRREDWLLRIVNLMGNERLLSCVAVLRCKCLVGARHHLRRGECIHLLGIAMLIRLIEGDGIGTGPEWRTTAARVTTRDTRGARHLGGSVVSSSPKSTRTIASMSLIR